MASSLWRIFGRLSKILRMVMLCLLKVFAVMFEGLDSHAALGGEVPICGEDLRAI